ncbi:hypothetical protein BVE84_03745 [Streptococcus azizii]|uniref:DUF1310 domain-containing protein n=1 Tax=Streptococcus azizii TaxID=1579424 RepID=A0AB36JSB4_9STRE|nr:MULTISPECIES: hypothetical protein [Streptococcus]MBF0775491.1 hypothetical protein [Streptococcus sp. 19428wD3_AN2]ONK28365.1 hypothetical protein BVE86_03185 [Streptococcus azizii]ONK28990.1 hypothetical protein BVE85_03915 [Streptococcus azizii]ONK30184.1 hypothetical protein BVE84_03745 [Streptococcus azizii]TFU84652.1 hypothetical protein E4T83_01690 [Streptococcus sp. AN2]
MKKRVSILILMISILGGLVMVFSLNGERQESAEEKRNREYEVSLVKALKNTYRDIEEIRISSPVYSNPPGDWSCYVEIDFLDEKTVGYHIGHSLGYKRNGSAIAHPDVVAILDRYYGMTHQQIRVRFSNGEERVE